MQRCWTTLTQRRKCTSPNIPHLSKAHSSQSCCVDASSIESCCVDASSIDKLKVERSVAEQPSLRALTAHRTHSSQSSQSCCVDASSIESCCVELFVHFSMWDLVLIECSVAGRPYKFSSELYRLIAQLVMIRSSSYTIRFLA